MRVVKGLLLVLMLIYAGQVYSQPASLSSGRDFNWRRTSEPDTNYVKSYRNKLLIALIGTRKYQHIDINNRDNSSQLTYKPNSPYSFGAGLSYNSLSVDLTLKLPFLTSSYRQKGETDIFRVRLGYNKPRIWFSTMVQIIKGFYLDNIREFDPEWFSHHDSYLLRPDIFNFSWYTAAYYSFNHRNITYQSSLGWEQRQKKSAGTLLLGGSVFVNYLTADSSMLPSMYASDFNHDMALTEQLNLQYGINCGYVHTLCLTQSFYLTLGIYPGIHYQTAHQIIRGEGKKDISGDFGSVTEARAVIGYNSDKYYGGMTLNEISILSFPQNTILTHGYAHLKLFVGRRFNLPDWPGRKTGTRNKSRHTKP